MKNNYYIKDDNIYIELNSKKHGNKITIVDIKHLEKLKNLNVKWYLNIHNKTLNPEPYVVCNTLKNKKITTLKLHRFLLDVDNPKLAVDHISHNTLDNTDKNLRVVTNQQNSQNRKGKYANNKTSKYRGVHLNKGQNKYESYINIEYKKIGLGYFETEKEAKETSLIAREIFLPYSEEKSTQNCFKENKEPSIYFRYGTMNSKKTYYLLKTIDVYEILLYKTLLFTSKKDDRFGENKVTSRLGLQRNAISVDKNTDIEWYIKTYNPDRIFCDEIHLWDTNIIEELIKLHQKYKIPIYCYGLELDFKGERFLGSEILLKNDFVIKQKIDSKCVLCKEQNSTHHLKLINNEPAYIGEQIDVGGNEKYLSVCFDCYKNPMLKNYNPKAFEKNKIKFKSNINLIFENKYIFGNILKEVIKKNKLSLRKIGNDCKMNTSTIKNMISGKINIKFIKIHQETISTLIRYLNINEYELLRNYND